jgi:hypothetical protein
MTTRTAGRRIFYRWMALFTVLMGLVSFALGYVLHPMY